MHELLRQFPSFAPYIKTILPYVQQYGYWAIFFAIYMEDFGLPIPGETVLIICSLFATLGELNLLFVGILGFSGAVLGDNTGFAIGRYAGRKIILKWGKYVFLTENRLKKLEHYFEKRGSIIVTVSRFIDGLRQFNGIIAGISAMKWKKFGLYNLIGAALWVGLWVGAATVLGNRKDLLVTFIKKSQYILPLIIISPLLIEGAYHLIKRIVSRNEKLD